MTVNGNIKTCGQVFGSISNGVNIAGSISKAENIYVKEIEFKNRYEFPSIGKENMIYVARDEHKMYIFNTATLAYEVVGSNYNEIEIIQGTL